MVFVHPHFLWLMLLAPAIAYAGYRGNRVRPARVALLRAAVIAAIVLALSRPMVSWHSSESETVVVMDLSAGVSAEALAAPLRLIQSSDPAHTTIIGFSNRSAVIRDRTVLDDAPAFAALRQQLATPLWSDDPQAGGANLAAAMQLAAMQVPTGGHATVKLYASGLSDHGDAAAEAFRLAQRGVLVDVLPLKIAPALPDIVVQHITLAASARLGEAVTADVVVDSTITGSVQLKLLAGERTIDVPANVKPGVNHVPATFACSKPGLMPVSVVDTRSGAAGPPMASIHVESASRLLLVQDEPEAGLAEGLAALLGQSAEVISVRPDEMATRSLKDIGAVVLADVPADRLSDAAQEKLQQAVRNGTGLLLTGAAKSFGPGGYDDSQLATLLPVRMPQQMESIDPSTTLVLIIDSSGSMSGDRIDLAKEVARLAISHLRPQDKVGIVEFFGGKRWAAPIQSAANLSVVHRALARLTAGGGTKLYPAVEEAAFTLRNIHTRSKHVLILSDGFVENAPFASLVRQMVADGDAVSTIQVGSDGGGPNMMPDIARWGGGRFYTVPDQFALPDISLKQPQVVLLSPVVLTPSAVVGEDDPLVRQVATAAWEPVQGYVRTTAKPTADVLLKTASGDPLLTRWRYGAGYVAALTTQLGSNMTGGLADQPQFAYLCASLLRQMDSSLGSPLQMTTIARPVGVEVDIQSIGSDASLPTGSVRLNLKDDHGRLIQTAQAEAIAPGHWNVLLPGVTAGSYEVAATLADEKTTGKAGVAVGPPASLLARGADSGALKAIEAFSSLAAERAALLPRTTVVFVDLQAALATAGVVLLLLLVAVRRWPMNSRKLIQADF